MPQYDDTTKTFDVTALGELLIDLTESGQSGQGNQLFEANPGGAPCNVLSMLSKLGKKTAFIGKVGDDFFGNHLKKVVAEAGINTDNLLLDEKVPTTLAFVHNLPDGDREFSFYRNPGADTCLSPDDVDEEIIRDSRIFHFGSLSMTGESVRAATMKALDIARESRCILSFDPNLREMLWDSLSDAKEQISYGMRFCDVLKISDYELQWFTGEEDYDRAVNFLRDQYDIKLILLSMGREGSRAYYKDDVVAAAPFLTEKTIDTTGAGDTFCACALDFILEHGLENLSVDAIKEMLIFSNAAASLVTTRKGALRVMPDREEIESLIKNGR